MAGYAFYKSIHQLLCVTGLLLFSLFPKPCHAFHSGGAGQCSGCHSMHSPSPTSQQLLLSSDPSSVCLNCHTGLGGTNSPSVFSPDGSALTPGGDFYWLSRSFSWLDGDSPGESHGHNIVALDYGLAPDPALTIAPGGTYPAANLSCISCHDPHGKVSGGTRSGSLPITVSGSYGEIPEIEGIRGNYRLLGDADYTPPGGTGFSEPAPIARQSSVNRFQESDSSHVAYGSGMSEWCGNCHQDFLTGGMMGGMGGGMPHHRAGNTAVLSPMVVSNYNTYLRTGDFSGDAATAYLQFVPFEQGVNDTALLDPHSTQGPGSTANVMCLSCHRAHASAFSDSGRWDFSATLLAESHPASGDIGVSGNDVYYSYYGRDIAVEFGAQQGPFCEKCHTDHGGMGGGMGM